jgi:hypothetical protein
MSMKRSGMFAWRSLVFVASLISLMSCRRAPAEHIVQVIGRDFAFDAPDTLDAGPTRFHFSRAGTAEHEVAISRVKRGITVAQVLAAEVRGDDPTDLVDDGVGLLFAAVGEHVESDLLVDLEAGRQYVLSCTRETAGKSHAMLGMVKGITVRGR